MDKGIKQGLGCISVAVVILAVIVSTVIYKANSGNKKVDEAGLYVLKALNIKYNKEFTIKDGHYITNTGGYEFTVYPKDDPDFTFTAWLNGMTESGESDGYFLALRTEQGKRMIAPFIKTISSDYYISAVGTGPNPKMKNYKTAVADVHENMLSIDQQLKKYPNDIEIDARVHINYNVTPKNENSVLKKVYNLIEFLKEKQFGFIRIALYFYDFPGKNLRSLAEKNINFTLDYFDKAKYTLVIIPSDIKDIHSYEDIKKIHNEVVEEDKEIRKNEQQSNR